MKSNQHVRFNVYTNQSKLQAQRTRELGHIHQGKKALGWSDDDYRYHLQQQTGIDSAASLDSLGRAKILAHMEKLGYKPKQPSFKPFTQTEKIKWLWKKLHAAGGLRDASDHALLAFIARTTGTGFSDVRFLATADGIKVIEALKSMLDRTQQKKGVH